MTTQDERVKEFLKKLTQLSIKYELEITAEEETFLYDHLEGEYAGGFGWSMFGGKYVAYTED